MLFFGCGKPDNLSVLSTELGYKNSCKYLDVHLDKNLLFREHIDHVIRRLKKFCVLIYRVRHLLPRKFLLMFYSSFAKSVIAYGSAIYGTTYKTKSSRIEGVQRTSLRLIFFRKRIWMVGKSVCWQQNFDCVWTFHGWSTRGIVSTTEVWITSFSHSTKRRAWFDALNKVAQKTCLPQPIVKLLLIKNRWPIVFKRHLIGCITWISFFFHSGKCLLVN